MFFANAADHVFNNLSPEPFADTTFTDTIQIRTLTKDIYYQVVAVDRNFNHSKFSEPLPLRKPDLVAPVSPVFSTYLATDTAVVLTFVPSSSTDVASHQLLRRSNNDTTWRSLATWLASDNKRTFIDRNIEGPAYYAYTLQATDSAGNRSTRSVPTEVRINRKFNATAPNEVVAVKTDGAVQVRWTISQQGVKHFVIYRSKDGAPMTSIASATASDTTYADIRLQGKGSYRYAVKTVYDNGTSSPLVESAVVVE